MTNTPASPLYGEALAVFLDKYGKYNVGSEWGSALQHQLNELEKK